jgi:molybdopterin/thiamine biosynthesis adenylyltransferase
MIVHELNSSVSTVRIHDDHCEADAQRLIGAASRVVSASYKRRYLSAQQEEATYLQSAIPAQTSTRALQF